MRLRCIAQYSTFLCCIAAERAALVSRCIGGIRAAMSSLGDLPEELQGCCARALDTSSVGCFGQVNKACKTLVEGRLAREKAARDRDKLEKVSSRWCEALAATWRVANGPNLVTFSDGGAKVRLVAFGEELPTVAEWLAFAASLPGGWAQMFVHQRRV